MICELLAPITAKNLDGKTSFPLEARMISLECYEGLCLSLEALNDSETRAIVLKECNVECASHRWGT